MFSLFLEGKSKNEGIFDRKTWNSWVSCGVLFCWILGKKSFLGWLVSSEFSYASSPLAKKEK